MGEVNSILQCNGRTIKDTRPAGNNKMTNSNSITSQHTIQSNSAVDIDYRKYYLYNNITGETIRLCNLDDTEGISALQKHGYYILSPENYGDRYSYPAVYKSPGIVWDQSEERKSNGHWTLYSDSNTQNIPTDLVGNETHNAIYLSMGSSYNSSIDYSGDKDFFQVYLEEGNTYRFNLDEIGLKDTYLRLRDANGDQIASDDDGGSDLNSQLTYVANVSGYYYLDARGYNDTYTGSYLLTAQEINQTESIYSINALNHADEGDNITFRIYRSGNTNSSSTVHFYTEDGTAHGDYSNDRVIYDYPYDTDFIGNQGEDITFTAGETFKDITVHTNVDSINENTEYFYGHIVTVNSNDSLSNATDYANIYNINTNIVNNAPSLTGTPIALPNGTEDVAYTLQSSDLLTGYSDADCDSLSVINVSIDEEFGTITNNDNGTWSYLPTTNFSGDITISYSVYDGELSVDATLLLTIDSVDDAPVISGPVDLGEIDEDKSIRITEAQLLEKSSDADGNKLFVSNLELSKGEGALTQNNDGSWTYAPAENWNGLVSFSYQVSDGRGNTLLTGDGLNTPTWSGKNIKLQNHHTTSDYNNHIYLRTPVKGDRFLFIDNTKELIEITSEEMKELGYSPGNELIFVIRPDNRSDREWLTGEASRNIDNNIHAKTTYTSEGIWRIGFEDFYGG